MLWGELDVKPDGAVTVAPAGELPIAETVRITPPFNLTFQVHQRLLDSIRDSGMPMYPGSRVMAEVFRGGAGMIVRIDAVSPSPARLGPDTEVELHKADTTVSERVIGLADVGGADGVIRRLRELVELPLLRPASTAVSESGHRRACCSTAPRVPAKRSRAKRSPTNWGSRRSRCRPPNWWKRHR